MVQEKNQIQFNKINKSREDLVTLYKDYSKLDSIKNFFKNHKENKYKRCTEKIFGIILLDLIAYIIGVSLMSFLGNYIIILISMVLLLLTAFTLKKNLKGVKNYQAEMTQKRDSEFCDILKKNNVNDTNIEEVINYFTIEIGSPEKAYERPTFMKPILSFISNLFYLIIGFLIPNLISDNFKTDKVKTYAYVFAILFFITISMIIARIYIYLNNKNKYLETLQKLISELSMTKILHKL